MFSGRVPGSFKPEVRRGPPSLAWVPVDAVLARAIGTADPGQAAEAVAALELLARLLTPDAPVRTGLYPVGSRCSMINATAWTAVASAATMLKALIPESFRA